ncbi:DUF2398 family protein [Dactylosporangium sp. NPDC051485]|uniref:DUF2398 family protein n=1 Tax=Dactylosporangium sp. NPDC051485 TaxID=3154846 RepID=UPI003426DA11
MSGSTLDPELAEAARHLTVVCRLSAAEDPTRYRTLLNGRRELAVFFRDELGWTLVINEIAGVVRLHKRRDDPPADRGPYVTRDSRPGPLAGTGVLVLVSLVCEQLWRRPRISLRELVQAIAQVSAAAAVEGRLPAFRIVATDGVSKRQAQSARQNLSDALKLLVAEGEITVDADVDRALADDTADCVITANRDSLATKFASLSPTLLGLAARPVQEHAVALTVTSLPDATPAAAAEHRASVDGRRLAALRRVVDDPGVDPTDDPAPMGYLLTLSGREKALTVAAELGLVTTVRRDWWEITNPGGAGTSMDFPQGRRTARQAALALLAELPRRPQPEAELPLAEIEAMIAAVRQELPRWGSSYTGKLALLAHAAAADLVAAGLLIPADTPDCWLPTPGIHLWRVHVRHGEPPPPATGRAASSAMWVADTLDLFDPVQQEELP